MFGSCIRGEIGQRFEVMLSEGDCMQHLIRQHFHMTKTGVIYRGVWRDYDTPGHSSEGERVTSIEACRGCLHLTFDSVSTHDGIF